MLERYFLDPWLPAWMRRTHPLVQHALRRPASGGLRYVVFGSAVGLFLLFGGLSLPILYLFVWVALLVQQAVMTARRVYDARDRQTWDLLRAAPFSHRELLLTTWAGSFWTLQQSWVMNIYRVLQGMAVIGVMVFGLWFAEFPIQHATLVLAVGLLAILMQPLAEGYFSGMIGLLCAGFIRQPFGALGTAVLAVLIYWCACLGVILLALFNTTDGLTLAQILLALGLPSLLPLALGYAALRAAEAALA